MFLMVVVSETSRFLPLVPGGSVSDLGPQFSPFKAWVLRPTVGKHRNLMPSSANPDKTQACVRSNATWSRPHSWPTISWIYPTENETGNGW